MKRLLVSVLIGLIMTLSGGTHATAQQPKWQHTDIVVSEPSLNDPAEDGGIAIYSQDQAIIIKTERRIEVRVFTILGQLVSQGEVAPGCSILNINSRGIYIVKIDNITQKVVL